jgi:hypothetical protein
MDGGVNVTGALPVESVVTIRLDSVPELVVNNSVPPEALPPDCPGFSLTENDIWLLIFAFCSP